ncbi:putative delta3, 5-delta2, 4-dienoyl-CoA isomerase precursor [Neurospora crassa]|nr:putative delta3, 5-delta2, 4-dienoyl-CoA isomerase precursor [Neurospora crassa]
MAQQQQPQLKGYTSYKHFNVTSAGPAFVVHVEINRPAKLNAFFEAMWLELGQIFRQLSSDPDVRAVVLSGAGDRGFTAGLDIHAASSNNQLQSSGALDVGRKAAQLRRYITEFQDSISAIELCEKPVIVVLHAISLGLAIDIACAADIRLCTRDVRLAVKEVDIGLAADIGTLSRLPKAVGNFSWVKEVCMSAREFGATEAQQVGFVSQVLDSKVAALDQAIKLAGLIAGKSPIAVQGTKELLNHARDHSVSESLRYTTVWNSAALQSRDMMDALSASVQKKKPVFSKL